jgi:phage terminase large subunit GpA-like protein
LYLVGTGAAKDLWYGRLKIAHPGAGHVRFHMELPADWFAQVTAERLVRKQINGRWRRSYELPRGARNEALDCLVYALVALYLAPVNRAKLSSYAAKPVPKVDPPPGPVDPNEALLIPAATKRRRPGKPSWANRW